MIGHLKVNKHADSGLNAVYADLGFQCVRIFEGIFLTVNVTVVY